MSSLWYPESYVSHSVDSTSVLPRRLLARWCSETVLSVPKGAGGRSLTARALDEAGRAQHSSQSIPSAWCSPLWS